MTFLRWIICELGRAIARILLVTLRMNYKYAHEFSSSRVYLERADTDFAIEQRDWINWWTIL